ncbi:MAG: 16S rRNA (adenine(1518)-N(6)/adenine(1519)-N(6))-dimethyltransferase RsmA [Dehalococcoidia bacterium]
MPASRRNEPAPRKALGQHFLRDQDVLDKTVKALGGPYPQVVEVGPGTGELTARLLAAGHTVLALEVDPRMLRHLAARFPGEPRLTVCEADARTVDIASVVDPALEYAVAGNLPYFAANPIVRHFLEAERQPARMVVMVQREVGREMAAPPGDYSLLSIAVQVYAEASVLFDVPPEAFDPPPAVVSSVIRLDLRKAPLVPPERNEAFFELVSKTFRNPRKQIHNALGRGVWLPPEGAQRALEIAGIDPMRRPETLTIPEWLTLLDSCERVRLDG